MVVEGDPLGILSGDDAEATGPCGAVEEVAAPEPRGQGVAVQASVQPTSPRLAVLATGQRDGATSLVRQLFASVIEFGCQFDGADEAATFAKAMKSVQWTRAAKCRSLSRVFPRRTMWSIGLA